MVPKDAAITLDPTRFIVAKFASFVIMLLVAFALACVLQFLVNSSECPSGTKTITSPVSFQKFCVED